MKNSTIRILVIFGALTITCLASVQFYLLKTSFNNQQRIFEHSVQVALFNVVRRLNNSDNSQLPQTSPIIKESSNYYIVDVNRDFTCEILEFYLISEFQRSNISYDFEFAIYDCYSDQMQYGNYVSFKENVSTTTSYTEFKKNTNLVYYFVVHFPKFKTEIYGTLKIWLIFSFIILCVLAFIIYAIWIILGQKRYSELQRSFVNTITHEFRTPISASNIAIEYLQQSEVIVNNTRLKKYTELINLQNSRLDNLIERLLFLSKSENKLIDLDITCVNITDLCKDVISVHKDKNAHANISLNSSGESIKIYLDEFHAVNILHALIDNAVKYSGDSPNVSMNIKENGKFILLQVMDNGIGIPKRYRKKIFQQFYRIPTGNIHNVKGFGIGLYYVKLLTKRMNWKITIADNPHKGSTFQIEIPLTKKHC